MRILMIGNHLADAQQSMQRFASTLELNLNQAGHEIRLIRPAGVLGRLSRDRPASKWFGYFDKFLVFPWIIRRNLRWAQVVHICDHSNAFYTEYLGDKPHIVTCHDLLAVRSALGQNPQYKTRWSGRLLQRAILKGLMRAQHVTCVSEATRTDLNSILRLPNHRVSVTYNGLNYSYSPMPTDEASARIRALGIDPALPYLVHVGGNQWYKNRTGVVKIFAKCRELPAMRDYRLVMVGKPWPQGLRETVSRERVGDATVKLSGVSSEDLRALYSLASLLLFPSLAEGFGWPIIEAQACGCRVATSNRAPMMEVAGNAAIFIDPENPHAAALAIDKALQTSAADCIALGRNADRFSTAQMISRYISLYNLVLQSARTSERSTRESRPTVERVRLSSGD